ncbi:MAG: hypothetical protein ABL904_16005 [Hyphomicrobiaceae bacterium]
MSPETSRAEPRPRAATSRRTTDIVTLVLGAALLVSLATKAQAEQQQLAGVRTAIDLLDKRYLRRLAPAIAREQDGTIHHPEREGIPPLCEFGRDLVCERGSARW